MNNNKSFSLRFLLLHLLRINLAIPFAILCLFTVTWVAYLGAQNLKTQQHQVSDSIAKSINNHIDNGGRILEAIARVAEVSSREALAPYMKSTWEAYGYFDTIYYLDQNNVITISFPFDKRYIGLDMSNVSDFKSGEGKNSIIISRSFISLRTGEPTVYLVRVLSNGGCIVGELSLGLFQKDITNISNDGSDHFVFVMDKSGTLIAHPSIDMVKQQFNMSNLDIFKSSLSVDRNLTYSYFDKSVFGTALIIEKTGWIVVDQTEMIAFWSSYAFIILLVFAGGILIFFSLLWNLGKQLRCYVATPLEELGLIVNELADGNYNQLDNLSTINASFCELNEFAHDFQVMSTKLRKREAALRESEERYRGLFNRVPIGLFRASLEGDLLDVNPAVVSIFGYPNKEDLLKIKIADIIISSSDPKESNKLKNRKEIPLSDFESQMYKYDRSLIWVRIKTYLVRNKFDNQSCYEGSLEDITKQKHAEKELIQAKEGLEIQVEQRTQQLVELNKELQQLSSLDGLTGINNRRYFDQFLENEWQKAMHQGTPVSLIILDLDLFKDYNDHYGHQAGDDCLKKVASAFKSLLRGPGDLAARYGGEEFVSVLPNTDLDSALTLAEKICKAIENLEIKHEKSSIGEYVTVSIGVASVVPSKDTLSSDIISIADKALYNAKREGRNRVCVGKNI